MSVFKSPFDSQNPTVSPGCVSVQLSKKKKRERKLERERKRKLYVDPSMLERTRQKIEGVKAGVKVESTRTRYGWCSALLWFQTTRRKVYWPSSAVLFLFSSYHVDDKLGDHGAG